MDIYSDFVEDVVGRTIAPNSFVTLLQVEKEDLDEYLKSRGESFELRKFVLRSCLSKCSVKVAYTDIYQSETWEAKRELVFFGRGLGSDLYRIQELKVPKVSHQTETHSR